MLDIRVLRYFLTIAAEGSLTAAAARLNLTQPTLSRQIKDLEEKLGQRLFIRGAHAMTLTAEGLRLKQRAEEIVSLVHKTEEEFACLKSCAGGRLHLGLPESASLRPIAAAAARLHNAEPSICFHILSGNAEEVMERLDKGLLDFGVVLLPCDISGWEHLDLALEDRWGVVLRRDSPLAARRTLNASDLKALPLICSQQVLSDGPARAQFEKWLGCDLSELNLAGTFNLVFNAALLAEAGFGCVLTLDNLVNTGEGSRLTFIPLEPALYAGLAVIWKKDQILTRPAELFLQELRAGGKKDCGA